ncbi:MAG: peptide chain release factor 1 [Candidatus Cloacimonetes bacterium]|nr:peptide chain release factor 1 [Candidatus Cloacimonadota bacterium]
MIPKDKLEAIQTEYEALKVKAYDPKEMTDKKGYRAISRRFKELEAILNCYHEWEKIAKNLSETKQFLRTEKDEELLEMAKMEIEETEILLEEKSSQLKELLVPKDVNDEKDVLIEIRAGTGGNEAALFAASLFRMYQYYVEKKGWKLSVISSNAIGIGGFKEIILQVSGENVYGTMRFESGVHRVQRVPQTEASGRIHTSAVSVAVLPEVEDIDIEISDSDLRIDLYRSSGHGGQSVNTTDSAVRLTHIPTGLVVTCQDEKSQLKNKDKAMKVLRARLYDFELAKQEAEIATQRRSQVGTGDRSAKIRTYNYPQSRVTDHRINLTSYKLNDILAGEIDEFIEALKIAYRNEKIEN